MTMTSQQYREQLAAAMSEAELQSEVLALAKAHGWRAYHTHDSRRSPGGFPDLVLVHAKAGRLIFAELKKQDGSYRPGQLEWLDDINHVDDAISRDIRAIAGPIDPPPPRVIAITWRPLDLLCGGIEAMLRERRR